MKRKRQKSSIGQFNFNKILFTKKEKKLHPNFVTISNYVGLSNDTFEMFLDKFIVGISYKERNSLYIENIKNTNFNKVMNLVDYGVEILQIKLDKKLRFFYVAFSNGDFCRFDIFFNQNELFFMNMVKIDLRHNSNFVFCYFLNQFFISATGDTVHIFYQKTDAKVASLKDNNLTKIHSIFL